MRRKAGPNTSPSSARPSCSTLSPAAGASPVPRPAASFTASELLAVMSARLLRDGQIVFVGIGTPLLAASLARQTHAPHLTILFEGGAVGPLYKPGELPRSTNEQR